MISGPMLPFRLANARRLGRLAASAMLLVAVAATPALARAVVFERVLETPCRALALDREPLWAALGDDVVTVQDKKGIREEPLPPLLRGAHQELGVFFGRDYRVRIAGTSQTTKGDEARYYRSLPGGLRPAPDELGPLGKAGAPGLVALLGTLDPEIVCRPGMSCLIKRISGWTKASAPSGLERVGLSLGTGWALVGASLFRLDKDWVAVGPASPGAPWQTADDAFIREQRACVIERKTSRMHHFDGQRWRSTQSPVSGPRSLWGTADSLWVAGEGGVAVFQDGAWVSIPAAPRGVAQVLGRDVKDVWLCSSQGVYRSQR